MSKRPEAKPSFRSGAIESSELALMASRGQRETVKELNREKVKCVRLDTVKEQNE